MPLVYIIHLIRPTNPSRHRRPGGAFASAAAWPALLCCLALASCSPAPGPAAAPVAPDAGEAPASAGPLQSGDATAPSADAGPVAAPAPDGGLLPLPLASAQAVAADGGAPLAVDSASSVDPSSTFEVRVGSRLPDARLVLLDAQDSLVASGGSTDVGAETVFRLAPAAPLRPGSLYTLRLEGLPSRAVADASGRTYEPLSFRLRAAGDPPPSPSRRKSTRRGPGP